MTLDQQVERSRAQDVVDENDPVIERPMNQPGFYSVVRFCPDSDRGEAVNIGVIVGAPALGLRVRMADQNERVEAMVRHEGGGRHPLDAHQGWLRRTAQGG